MIISDIVRWRDSKLPVSAALEALSRAALSLMFIVGAGGPSRLCAQKSDLRRLENTSTNVLREAKASIESSEFHHAVDILNDLLSNSPRLAVAHEMLAYSYLRMNDPASALEQYTLAAAIQSPTAEDLQNVSKAYVLLEDMPSAERWIKVSLELNDRAPESWYVFGRIRYTQRRAQDAVDCFSHVLSLLPRTVKAANNLGLSYEALNRRDDAIAAYREAISWQKNDLHPSEQPLLNLGILLMREGYLEQAGPLLLEAVALAPESAPAHEQLGHLFLALHSYPKAQTELESAVKLDPKRAALHFLLGRAYHLAGEEDKARTQFATSAALSGEHSTPEDH